MKSIGIPPSNQWFLAFGALTNVYIMYMYIYIYTQYLYIYMYICIYNDLQAMIQNIIRGVWFFESFKQKNGTARTFVGDSTLQAGSKNFTV